MYLITGGAGFIGSALLARLNSEGIDDIIVVDRLDDGTTSEPPKWKNLTNKQLHDFIPKDRLLKLLAKGRLPKKLDAIVHLGACSSTTEPNAAYIMENNYSFSKRIAEYALEKGIRFIYASSAATYGDGSAGFSDDESGLSQLRPLNAYALSKQLFDLWARKTGALERIAGLKFFNVYGPNEYHKGAMASVVYKAFNQIRATGKLELFKSYRAEYADGEQKRDFIYVKDCSEVLWWMLHEPEMNGLYNVGTGTARTWTELAHAVFTAMGVELNIEYVEMPEHMRDKYQYFTEAPMGKLSTAECPYTPTTLEAGVKDYVENYLKTDYPYL